MKKFLFVAIAMMMSLVANAQLRLNKEAIDFQSSAMQKAPAKAAALEGTDTWGYYLGENIKDFIGLGNGKAGVFRAAVFVPGDGILKGAKIRGLNIPAVSALTDVEGWVANGLSTSSYVASKTIGSMSTEWKLLEFDEPIEIPEKGLYAGFTCTDNGKGFPIPTTGEDIPGGLFIALSKTANLQDYSEYGFGVCGVQVLVEGMAKPENAADVLDVTCYGAGKGTTGNATLRVLSNGTEGVKSIGYVINVNGVESTGTADVNPNIEGGVNKMGNATISFTAPDAIGTFPATIDITTINGQPNYLTTKPAKFNISTVTRVVPHMTVVEEYTGTGCGYCPRGWVGMEAVKHNQSDKALVIAWHKYNTNDPMYQANYADIPFDGAPQCTVDRRSYPDPYTGEKEEGIMECVNKYNLNIPTVDVKVKANFVDETNKEVHVTADTEFLTNTKGYTIAFVLTADELAGTTTYWKQSNYYYQYTTAQADVLPSMPDLAKFCKGGEYGKSSVAITFNDAMIGSTYNSTKKSQVPAFTTGQAGDIETSEYTIAMPTKSTLVGALKYDKIYVTALVINEKGQIVNAARARVLGAGETAPIEKIDVQGLKVSDINEETQLMGEAMSPNAKYVVGANFATYAPAVWNVETNEYINFPEMEEGCFHAANSDGLFVGDDGDYAIKADANGNVTKLFYNVGEEIETEFGPMSTGDAGSSAYAISEDGKTVAGFYFDASYKTTPCIWNENNERIDLPLPTKEEIGFEIDGGEVRYMTSDAKILAGFLVDNFSTWPACIWRQNETGGYDIDVVCKEYWEESYKQGKPYMVFNPTAISANGEWLALSVQKEFDDVDFNAPMPTMQMARMNLTNNALEVLEDDNTVGYAPTSIANDGTMVAYTGGNAMLERVGYIWPAEKKETINLNDILVNSPELENLVSNTPSTISADGKYIQGFGLTGESLISYVFDYDLYLTGVDNVKVDTKIITDRIYNINGQQVNNMNARGLYIVNGKKCVVK